MLVICFWSQSVVAQPTVTALSPARNAQVARTATVSVSFSQAVDARSTRALRVFSSLAGGKKSGTGSITGTQLTFTPSIGFKAGETVWATLDTAARGLNRVPIVRSQVWQLTAATSASSGVFSGGSTISIPSGAYWLTVGDVDNDGDVDLLAGHDAYFSVRLNDGTGDYYSAADIPTANRIQSAKLGDIDGDGDLDLV